MKRALFLATAALLAMLILAPMVMAQGTTMPWQDITAPWVGEGALLANPAPV